MLSNAFRSYFGGLLFTAFLFLLGVQSLFATNNYTLGTTYRNSVPIILGADIDYHPETNSVTLWLQDRQTSDNVILNANMQWVPSGNVIGSLSSWPAAGAINVGIESGATGVAVYAQYQNSDSSFSAFAHIITVPLSAKYYVNVTFPAGGSQSVLYFVFQDGVQIASHMVAAGSAPQVVRYGPLDTDHPVTVRPVIGGFLHVPDGEPNNPIASDDTVMGPGVTATPAAGSGSGGGADLPVPPGGGAQTPANPVAGGDPVTPPPDVQSGPGGGTINTPNPNPAGAGGATTADIQTQTNQLVSGLNAVGSAVSDASGKAVETGNAIKDSVTVGANGIINAVNKVTVAVNKANASLDIIAQKARDERAEQVSDRAAWTAHKDSSIGAVAGAKDTAMRSVVSGAMGTNGISAPQSASQSSAIFSITIGNTSRGGIQAASFAPWDNDAVQAGFALIKGMLAVMISFIYIRWLQQKIFESCRTLILTPQNRGNTVAGSGGQITGLIASGIITGILLAAPTTFAALGDTGLGWKSTLDLFGAIRNAAGGMPVFDLLDAVLPLATIGSAATSVCVVHTACTGLVLGIGSAIRWVVPVILFSLCLYSAPSVCASITVINFDPSLPVDVSFAEHGAETVRIDPFSTGTFEPSGRAESIYFTFWDDGVPVVVYVADALDGSSFGVKSDTRPVAGYSMDIFLSYFRIGFVTGLLWELGGLCYRLLYRLFTSNSTNSVEAGPL